MYKANEIKTDTQESSYNIFIKNLFEECGFKLSDIPSIEQLDEFEQILLNSFKEASNLQVNDSLSENAINSLLAFCS